MVDDLADGLARPPSLRKAGDVGFIVFAFAVTYVLVTVLITFVSDNLVRFLTVRDFVLKAVGKASTVLQKTQPPPPPPPPPPRTLVSKLKDFVVQFFDPRVPALE